MLLVIIVLVFVLGKAEAPEQIQSSSPSETTSCSTTP